MTIAPRMQSVLLFAGLALMPVATNAQSTPPSSDADHSWTSTGGQRDPSGNQNPTRTRQSHTKNGGRTTDTQSIERLGPDGRYIPYLDIESESVQVDANTVRTVQRSFARDSDGRRTLQQVTEVEQRNLGDGRQNTVRTTSNPDVNGRLQIADRQVEESKKISATVSETKTTVLTPNINGGLTPAMVLQERDTQISGQTQFRKSTLLPDGNGGWQISEVREGSVKQEGKDRISEERVLQPNAEGRLAVTDRTVKKESEAANGEGSETTESYSTSLPGTSADGSLHLNERTTKVRRNRLGGGQVTEERMEERNPGEPGATRVTQKTIDIVRPGTSGESHERTVQSVDANGNASVVWVDTQKTTQAPAVQVQIAPAAKPK